jgi:glutamine cyclotransferase
MIVVGVVSLLLAAPAVTATRLPAAQPEHAAAIHGFEVVHAYPHDHDAFTQGLIFRDGFLYESTGLNGRSSLRKVRLESGAVLQQRRIDRRYFAEGLTDWRDRLIQLTWDTSIGFVYDLATFAPRSTFTYPGEGWGLTHDDRQLIMSDGTSSLRFLDPETMRETRRVTVMDGARPVDQLNELEYVKGRVYANVWLTDRIAMIDPAGGRVEAWIDLSGLRGPSAPAGNDVLNGIAYDAAGDRLFVTGKLWPRLFEIRLRQP